MPITVRARAVVCDNPPPPSAPVSLPLSSVVCLHLQPLRVQHRRGRCACHRCRRFKGPTVSTGCHDVRHVTADMQCCRGLGWLQAALRTHVCACVCVCVRVPELPACCSGLHQLPLSPLAKHPIYHSPSPSVLALVLVCLLISSPSWWHHVLTRCSSEERDAFEAARPTASGER